MFYQTVGYLANDLPSIKIIMLLPSFLHSIGTIYVDASFIDRPTKTLIALSGEADSECVAFSRAVQHVALSPSRVVLQTFSICPIVVENV